MKACCMKCEFVIRDATKDRHCGFLCTLNVNKENILLSKDLTKVVCGLFEPRTPMCECVQNLAPADEVAEYLDAESRGLGRYI